MTEIQKENLKLRERAEKAETACAEMREHIEWLHGYIPNGLDGWPHACNQGKCSALSTDCGKGVLEKIQKLRDALISLRKGYWVESCHGCYPLPYPAESKYRRDLIEMTDQALEETK